MADEIKIIISTDVAAAKRDTAKLAQGFKVAEQAANKTTTAVKKTNEALKKQEGFWTTLGKRLRSFSSAAGLANETFRILRLRSMEFTRSIIQFGVRSTKASSDFLGFRNALQIASGSLSEANKSMQKADEIATTLGLDLTAVTKEYSKFVNSVTLAGQTMGFAEKSFQQFAVTARVLNLNGQETSGMFLALEQMVSKGTVSMEELRRQLGQHLPGAVALAAKAMGYGKDQLKEFYSEVRKGNVASDELVGKLGNLLARRTAPLLEQALEKSTVAVTRFKNELLKLQITIGQYLQPAVTWFFNSLATLVGWFRTSAFESTIFQNEVKDVADALKSTAGAVEPVVTVYNEFSSAADKVTATLGTNIGAIGLLGITATTSAKSVQLLVKAVKWLAAPLVTVIGYIGRFGALIALVARLHPVIALVTAAGAALAAVAAVLSRTMDNTRDTVVDNTKMIKRLAAEQELAAQSTKNWTEQLNDLSEKLTSAGKEAEDLGTSLLGASYGLATAQLAELDLTVSTLKDGLTDAGTVLANFPVGSSEFEAVSGNVTALGVAYSDALMQQSALKQTTVSLFAALKAYSDGINVNTKEVKANEKATAKLVTDQQKLKAAYDEEVKVLNFYVDDIDTATKKEELFNLTKQFGNATRAKTIQGLKEEVELNKAMAEWREEQAEAIESPDKTPFDDFDNSPMQEFLENAPDQAMELENVYVNAFKSMEDSMTSFLTTGKLNFADFAKSIISDLARMIAKQLIFNAISGLFGGGGGAVSAGTTAFGSSTGAFAKGIGGFTARGLADGTNYVPRDGLKYLHKGEAVVPAKYNKEQDVRQGKTTIININGVTDFGSFRRNIDQLRNIDQREQAHATRNL